MHRVRRSVKPCINTNGLESRALLSDLPVVAPPALIFVAPPSAPRVIAGPIPIQVPAPYPSTTQGPVIAPPPDLKIDTTIPLPAQLTDPHDPLQSGDPLRIAPPPVYPSQPQVAPKSVALDGTFPVPPIGEIDTTRGIAPSAKVEQPKLPEPPPSTPPTPSIDDIYKEMDRIRRELSKPPQIVPPNIEIHEVPPTWQDYWDQLKKLVPYIPPPASTPVPVLP